MVCNCSWSYQSTLYYYCCYRNLCLIRNCCCHYSIHLATLAYVNSIACHRPCIVILLFFCVMIRMFSSSGLLDANILSSLNWRVCWVPFYQWALRMCLPNVSFDGDWKPGPSNAPKLAFIAHFLRSICDSSGKCKSCSSPSLESTFHAKIWFRLSLWLCASVSNPNWLVSRHFEVHPRIWILFCLHYYMQYCDQQKLHTLILFM